MTDKFSQDVVQNVEMKHLMEAIERLGDKVDKLDESIRGNGKEGLNTRVKSLEDWKEELSDDIQWQTRALIMLAIGIAVDLMFTYVF